MGTAISGSECTATMKHGIGNLLDVYVQATVEERVAGRDWYFRAYEEAVRISRLYDVKLETVVKVACALSPRLTWQQNMPAAEAVIRHFISGGYVPSIDRYVSGEMKLQRTKHSMSAVVIADDAGLPHIQGPTKVNIVKALWVLQGHEWVLRGKKVNSFLDNILNWATSQAVTVDSHAIQVWRGKMEEGTYAVPASFYKVIEADYRTVAAMVGLTPLQFQAVVWLVKKRITAELKKAKAAAKKAAKKAQRISEREMAWVVAYASDDPATINAARREMLAARKVQA